MGPTLIPKGLIYRGSWMQLEEAGMELGVWEGGWLEYRSFPKWKARRRSSLYCNELVLRLDQLSFPYWSSARRSFFYLVQPSDTTFNVKIEQIPCLSKLAWFVLRGLLIGPSKTDFRSLPDCSWLKTRKVGRDTFSLWVGLAWEREFLFFG